MENVVEAEDDDDDDDTAAAEEEEKVVRYARQPMNKYIPIPMSVLLQGI